MRYAVILAGGSGTRLWPMSRAALPKQLIPLFGGRSLLHVAIERLQGVVPRERLLLCTAEKYRAAVGAALEAFDQHRIIGEPEPRDTLAAVGLPAAILAQRDPAAVLAVLTSDHLIRPEDVFRQRLEQAFALAEADADALVTFGVQPTYAATAYGYVERGAALDAVGAAFHVARFVEKPDAATAAGYLASGRYLWNSGMFVWQAATVLRAIERFKPAVAEGLRRIAAAWDTPQRDAVLAAVYPALEKKSVDFGIMEPASVDPAFHVLAVELPVEWLDVGSWAAFAETVAADADGNRVAAPTAALLDCRQTCVIGDDPRHLIAAIGLDDLVIVHTADATLICHRAQAERLKDLHRIAGERWGDQFI